LNFATGLENFSGRSALILEDGAAVSYGDLARLADAVFRAPDAPTSRTLVALECANTLASISAYLGAIRNDIPVLLVDAQLASDLREPLYQLYRVGAVRTADGRWEKGDCDAPVVHPDVGVLLSTSGSTGAAKLVKLTHANLQANAESIVASLALDVAERPVTTLPIHYSYGLSVLNSHLQVGATLLLTSEPVTSRAFWDFFRAHEATSFSGVPAIYAMLKQFRFERMALPSLRTMTQAGGRLGPELVKWFGELAASRGQRFVVMYGQTEAAPRMSYVPPARTLEKIGSIGVALPDGQLDIVADDGSVITETGVIGELRYSGPNVMMGYAETAGDLATGDIQQGVLLTGDLAWRDADGYFYLMGRRKRFIKVFGNRIGLDEVEQQLQAKGYDAAVTGRDDLLVVAVRGDAAAVAELTAGIPTWYRLHHSAIRVAAVDAFPMSSSGKIQYGSLLDTLVTAS
jgi:acyl-coenzyme A synthetase/AMP-(fatty) acid ligase